MVMGDAAEYFTWHALNAAMNVLLKLDDKKLITLGAGCGFVKMLGEV